MCYCLKFLGEVVLKSLSWFEFGVFCFFGRISENRLFFGWFGEDEANQ